MATCEDARKIKAGTFDPTKLDWYKIVAIVMKKQGLAEIEITEADLELVGHDKTAVVADLRRGHFVVRVMTNEEARRMVKEALKKGDGVA